MSSISYVMILDTRKGLNVELYDVKSDQGERNNLASQYPAVVGEIRKMMHEAHTETQFWGKEYSDFFNLKAACALNGVEPEGKWGKKINNKKDK